MSTRLPASRVLMLVTALILQAFVLVQLLLTSAVIPTSLLVLVHIGGALLWGAGAVAFFPAAQRHAWWQSAAWALAFPIAGPLASLAFAAILHRAPVDRSAKGYVIWNDESHQLDGHTPGGAGQSIVEILQSPRTQLRRNAVLALRDLDPQLAIPLLRKGLQDSDEQVRIYAQNILSTMLERFEAGIKELEERLRADPTQTATARRLAEQYFELVYLDVAGDEETSAHYLTKALALLERVAAQPNADRSVSFLGFRYALRARDVAAARRWLARLPDEEVEAQHVLPWLMELAFLEGDWRRLRALFAGFRRARLINRRIEDLADFWLGPVSPGSRPS